jgi:hypothetical protein
MKPKRWIVYARTRLGNRVEETVEDAPNEFEAFRSALGRLSRTGFPGCTAEYALRIGSSPDGAA